MLMHKEAHRPKTVRPAMSPARQQFHDRLKQRFKLQREADAVALRAIVDEHTLQQFRMATLMLESAHQHDLPDDTQIVRDDYPDALKEPDLTLVD